MSTAQRAAEIRSQLKAYGYTGRQVSVIADLYSMGSSIRIKIKDARVPSTLVEMIANKHESIDRDQFGEILSGGNRFVFVTYSEEAATTLAAPYLPKVEAALAQLGDNDNSLIDVEGLANCRIGKGRFGYGVALWGKQGHIAEYNTAEGAARHIGQMVVNS